MPALQVGKDQKAQAFLATLDNDPTVGSNVDCTSYYVSILLLSVADSAPQLFVAVFVVWTTRRGKGRRGNSSFRSAVVKSVNVNVGCTSCDNGC